MMKINNIYIKNIIKKYFLFTDLGMRITSFGGYNHKDLKLIKYNKAFRNIHKGKRCFILGNGPSLSKEDLSKLKSEIVFVVNQASKISEYNKISPEYYFCVDQVFFSLDSNDVNDKQTIDSFISLKSETCNPICFIPAKYKEAVKKYEIDKLLEVRYFVEALRMVDKRQKFVDYTKVVTSFGTVVQYAITMAVYMGFEKIYLLGCDNTGIVATINSILKKDNDELYSYAVSENENKRMERMVSRNGLEAYCESYLYTLQDYRKLFKYCASNGCQLINCSSSTVIDSIPRKKLSDIL